MGSNNVAFASLWSTGDILAAIDLLRRTGRLSEAVLFAQTYKPSKAQELAVEWKESLEKQGKAKVSRLLGVPGQDEELFPEWDEYIKLEEEGGGDGSAAPAETNLIEVNSDEAPETNGTTEVDVDGVAEDDA